MGSTCSAIAGSAIHSCTSPDGLIRGFDWLLPGADDIVPMTVDGFDEGRTLRGFCRTMRQESALYAPDAYNDETVDSCTPEPVYPR